MSSEEAKLKRVLGLPRVMAIAIGQIIGAGVMSLTGIGIALTGSGVTPAFVLSAILTVITTLPIAVMGSAIPTTGGMYRYSSRLLSSRFGFFFLLLFILGQLTIAVYAISFAQYVQGLAPTVPIMLTAFIILTLFYIFNLVGVGFAASAEGVMVVVKLIAILVFVFWGVPHIHWAVFNSHDMFPSGLAGFFTATGLVGFATGGASVIAELGGEMKRPSRDIPLTIVVTTVVIGIIYAFMAAVASGVLPIAQVAGKQLTDVARSFLPHPLFLFFMIGGAMFAIASTLNSTLSWVTKGILIACEDGWLPKRLGAVNRRFGTPHYLLTVFYLIGAIPIVTGIKLGTIAEMGTGVLLFTSIIPIIAATRLPSKYPELYAKAPFKMTPKTLYFIAGLSVVLLALQGYLLLKSIPRVDLYLSIAYMIAAALYVYFVGNRQTMKARKVGGFGVQEVTVSE